jgi:hypothetical protein
MRCSKEHRAAANSPTIVELQTTEMSKELYLSLASQIDDVSPIVKPNRPVAIALQEAEELFEWCQPDRAPLTAAGLNWQLVDELPIRTAACRYIQTVWQNESQAQNDIVKQCKEMVVEGYTLRSTIIRTLRHAFRHSEELPKSLRHKKKYTCQDKMVQDIISLAALGKSKPDLLADISFDPALLDQAITRAEEIAVIMARAHNLTRSDTYDSRNKAYSYLKQAVDEIRRCGKFAFSQQPNRLKGYRSMYNHRKKS